MPGLVGTTLHVELCLSYYAIHLNRIPYPVGHGGSHDYVTWLIKCVVIFCTCSFKDQSMV